MWTTNNYGLKIFSLLGVLFLINSCEFSNHSQIQPINSNTQQLFIKGSQDIPLVNGLNLIDDEDIEFDTILGGFESSNYFANIATEIIAKFYLENLPKLGWKLEKNFNNQIIFKRENQKLSIKFYLENEKEAVNFSLTTEQR